MRAARHGGRGLGRGRGPAPGSRAHQSCWPTCPATYFCRGSRICRSGAGDRTCLPGARRGAARAGAARTGGKVRASGGAGVAGASRGLRRFGPVLRNVTSRYAPYWRPVPPAFVNAGDPLFAPYLSGDWMPAREGTRIMRGTARIHMAAPAPGERIWIGVFAQSPRLSVHVNGVEIKPKRLRKAWPWLNSPTGRRPPTRFRSPFPAPSRSPSASPKTVSRKFHPEKCRSLVNGRNILKTGRDTRFSFGKT